MGLQESCPQNNFRRIIAASIPPGEFCNHKINYFPEHSSAYPLEVLLAILNSGLADWYFRLGSTNASVSHYQLYNLPAPAFADGPADDRLLAQFAAGCDGGDVEAAYGVIGELLASAPFPATVMRAMQAVVERIIAIEQTRGEIARTERSALDPKAQPLQDLLDRILYRMAGLTEAEARGLEARLAKML